MENPDTLHVNALPTRAYFIPYQDAQSAMRGEREASERMTLLNGMWDFAYISSYAEMPETVACPDQIPVPSVWQMKGYDRHQYSNVKYPFPYDPPFVPADNPVGVYRRSFTLRNMERKAVSAVFRRRGQLPVSVCERRVRGIFAGIALHQRV